MFDLTKPRTLNILEEMIFEAKKRITGHFKVIYLANKEDLKNLRAFKPSILKNFSNELDHSLIEVSSLSGLNIDFVAKEMLKVIL